MHIVYHCFGGAHSSPVAAAIHTGRLDPRAVTPHGPGTLQLVEQVPHFDRTRQDQWGQLLWVGRDGDGNDVWVLGHGPHAGPVLQALMSGYRLAGGSPADLVLVNTLPCVNLPMRIGGYLSRRLGLVAVGRPLVAWGTRRALAALTQVVANVRRRIAGHPNGQLTTAPLPGLLTPAGQDTPPARIEPPNHDGRTDHVPSAAAGGHRGASQRRQVDPV